jgi:replicative DNA helicase
MDNIHAIQIEKAVLSSFLFDYTLLEEFEDMLVADNFYLPAHKHIFQAMLDLHREDLPIDEEFIRQKVDKKEVYDSVIVEILSANAITNSKAYVDEIIEASKKRKLIELTTHIKNHILEDDKKSIDVQDFIEQFLNDMDKTSGGADDVKTFGEWEEIYENEPQLERIPTGIKFIDKTLDGGVQVGQFIFASGKKETGKTYIWTTAMENMARDGVKCGFFSMEFGTKTYIKNTQEKYPHKDNKTRVGVRENVIVEHRVQDINDIERKVKKMHKKGVKFIFIDSQLRVSNAGMAKATKAERLADSFSRIGLMAQKYEIAIVMVVQTSKADHDSDEISVKGCIDADHEASVWLHLTKQKDSEIRTCIFAKNKQNFKRPKLDLEFIPHTHEFKVIKNHDDEDDDKRGHKTYSNAMPEVTTFGGDNEIPQLEDIPDCLL